MAPKRCCSSAAPPSEHIGSAGDRLGDLPEHLRLHILSLLPLKSAIRTGVLSSRWSDLWRHRLPDPSSLHLSFSGASFSPSDFDDILLRRGIRRLDSLHLSLRRPKEPQISLIVRLLTYASQCSVEDLRLHFISAPRRFNVPFTCDCPSLVYLHLSGFLLPSPSTPFRLGSLEVLCLHSVSLTDAALRRILSNLPQLRKLDIRRCPELRRISVPGGVLRLTSLTVERCQKAFELAVSAPNLRSFRFVGSFLVRYSFEGVWAPLEDLYIKSGGPGATVPRSNWVRDFGGIADHVKVMTLCSLALQYLASADADLIREFGNLRNLTELQLLMMIMADSNLSDIYSFFRRCYCPRLKTLFIELPINMHDPYVKNFLEVAEEGAPEVPLENLKVIKMNGFMGHYNEMLLLKFLLGRAGCLEYTFLVSPPQIRGETRADVAVDEESDRLHFLHMSLGLVPKASENAQIVLSKYDDSRLRPVHAQVS